MSKEKYWPIGLLAFFFFHLLFLWIYSLWTENEEYVLPWKVPLTQATVTAAYNSRSSWPCKFVQGVGNWVVLSHLGMQSLRECFCLYLLRVPVAWTWYIHSNFICIRSRDIRKVCKHRPFWNTFLLPAAEHCIEMESVLLLLNPTQSSQQALCSRSFSLKSEEILVYYKKPQCWKVCLQSDQIFGGLSYVMSLFHTSSGNICISDMLILS